jgi:hypothetical protein
MAITVVIMVVVIMVIAAAAVLEAGRLEKLYCYQNIA